MHQLNLKLLGKAYRQLIPARHLDAGLRNMDATLSRIKADVDAGMLHPLQQIAPSLPCNQDGLGMRLQRLGDFLDSRGYRVRPAHAPENLTQ